MDQLPRAFLSCGFGDPFVVLAQAMSRIGRMAGIKPSCFYAAKDKDEEHEKWRALGDDFRTLVICPHFNNGTVASAVNGFILTAG